MSLTIMDKSHPQAARQRRARSGAVTLIEVLLVLAVLSLVAAATWPALERSFANQRLRDAADLVRAEWSSARAKAMESGVPQEFHYALEDRTFWVEACEDASGYSNGTIPSAAGQATGNTEVLPDQVFFHRGTVETGSAAAASNGDPFAGGSGTNLVDNGESGAAIVFYSDGTCSSARLVLRNEYDRQITLTLRSLTGMAEVSEITAIEGTSL